LTKLISKAISDISIGSKDHLSRRKSSSPRAEIRSPPNTLKSKIPSVKPKNEKVSIFFGDHQSQHSRKESERYKDFDDETIRYDSGQIEPAALRSPTKDQSSDYDKTVCVDSNQFLKEAHLNSNSLKKRAQE
jgi:hypothetical protein